MTRRRPDRRRDGPRRRALRDPGAPGPSRALALRQPFFPPARSGRLRRGASSSAAPGRHRARWRPDLVRPSTNSPAAGIRDRRIIDAPVPAFAASSSAPSASRRFRHPCSRQRLTEPRARSACARRARRSSRSRRGAPRRGSARLSRRAETRTDLRRLRRRHRARRSGACLRLPPQPPAGGGETAARRTPGFSLDGQAPADNPAISCAAPSPIASSPAPMASRPRASASSPSARTPTRPRRARSSAGSTMPRCARRRARSSPRSNARESSSLDFILTEAGEAHLIELNARPIASGHLGRLYGHDVYAAAIGVPAAEPPARAAARGRPVSAGARPRSLRRASRVVAGRAARRALGRPGGGARLCAMAARPPPGGGIRPSESGAIASRRRRPRQTERR